MFLWTQQTKVIDLSLCWAWVTCNPNFPWISLVSMFRHIYILCLYFILWFNCLCRACTHKKKHFKYYSNTKLIMGATEKRNQHKLPQLTPLHWPTTVQRFCLQIVMPVSLSLPLPPLPPCPLFPLPLLDSTLCSIFHQVGLPLSSGLGSIPRSSGSLFKALILVVRETRDLP